MLTRKKLRLQLYAITLTISLVIIILYNSYSARTKIHWHPYSETQVNKSIENNKVLLCVLASWDISSSSHKHNFIESSQVVKEIILADGVRCYLLDLANLSTNEIEKWKDVFKSNVPMGVLIYHPDTPSAPTIIEVDDLSEDKIISALK